MQTGYGGDWEPREGALRAEDAEAAKNAQRRQAGRIPPILSGGPLGSYRGALVFLVAMTACLALVLYDLGVLWNAPPRDAVAVVTLSADRESPFSDLWLAFDGQGERLVLPRGRALPPEGATLPIRVHSRYGAEHIYSVGERVGGPPRYLEPEHSVTINGLIGLGGAAAAGGLAAQQVRLARRQRGERRAWLARHPSP